MVLAPDWSVVGTAPSLELIPRHCSRRQFSCLSLFFHVPEGLLAGLVDRVLEGVNVALLEHYAPLLVPILAKVFATPGGVCIVIIRLGFGRPWSLCIGVASIDMTPIGSVRGRLRWPRHWGCEGRRHFRGCCNRRLEGRELPGQWQQWQWQRRAGCVACALSEPLRRGWQIKKKRGCCQGWAWMDEGGRRGGPAGVLAGKKCFIVGGLLVRIPSSDRWWVRQAALMLCDVSGVPTGQHPVRTGRVAYVGTAWEARRPPSTTSP